MFLVVVCSRKIALLWEVVQMRRNAELYNEERSLIVSHARILVNTLCRFISSASHDPLAFYREEEGGEGEGEVEDGAWSSYPQNFTQRHFLHCHHKSCFSEVSSLWKLY